MKNKIHYSPESRRDLDDIWDYIVSELQNRSAAERVINRIIDTVDPLKNFAEMGTPLSSIADIGTDYRFLVSGNYMVFYRVQGKHRLTRAHREKQLKMSCQALHNAPPNRT